MSKDLAAAVQFVELVGGAGGDGFGRVVAVQQRPDAVIGRRGRPDAAVFVQLVELLPLLLTAICFALPVPDSRVGLQSRVVGDGG